MKRVFLIILIISILFTPIQKLQAKEITELKIYISSASDPCSFVEKTITINDYGLTSKGHFRILSESSLNLNSSMLAELDNLTEEAFNSLYSFFNILPYDQDGDGVIEVLIARLNEAYNKEVFVSGYSFVGKDPNNLGLVYIDSLLLNERNQIDFYITFSHELFHLMQASLFDVSLHATWLIEGTAVFASDIAIKNYSPVANSISLAYSRFNVSLLTPAECLSLDSYVANYLISTTFIEFLAEKYGITSIKKLLYLMKDNNDMVSLQKLTNSSFTDLLSEFAIWNYLGLYRGTSITFEDVKVYANVNDELRINSSITGYLQPFSIYYIKLLSDSKQALISFEHQGNLTIIVMKIKGDRHSKFSYTISKIQGEKVIAITDLDKYNETVLAIVNSGFTRENFRIAMFPMNYTVNYITQTATSISTVQDPLLIIILIILASFLLVMLVLFIYKRK